MKGMLAKPIENLVLKLREFLKHPGVRRYGANTAWLFSEQILRMVAGFFVGVWVARYLGPEKYGLFSYALAFVSIFQGIARLGLDGILVRDLVRESEKAPVYLGTAFWLKLFGAIATLVFIGIAVQFTNNDITTNLYIFIITLGLVFQSFDVIDFYFQSKVLAKFVSISRMVQLVVPSLIKIYLVLTKADLFWFVLVALIDMITLAISLNLAYRYNKGPSFYKYFDIDLAKRLLKNSWPLILSSIATAIYMRIDQVMIKNMLGDKEVGLYSAAVRVVEVWYFIPSLITQSVFPAIVNAKKVSEELYYRRLQQLSSFLIWIAIFVALTVLIFSQRIIYTLYGEGFNETRAVLAISVWNCLAIFIGIVYGKWCYVENKITIALIGNVIGGTLNIVLNAWLIPLLGIKGAAWSMLLSQLMVNYFYLLFNRESIKLWKIMTYSFIFPLFYFLKRDQSYKYVKN